MAGYLQQAPQPQQYAGGGGGAISANAYSNGPSQNNGNVMTGRSTTRRLAPPGGQSSFSIGWDSASGGIGGVGGVGGEVSARGGKRINHRVRAGQAIVGGGPAGGGIGRGTAHMFPRVQLPERKHEFIGYQKPEIAGSRWQTTNSAMSGRRSGVGAAGASIMGGGNSVGGVAGVRSSKPYANRDSGRINQVLGSQRVSPRLRPTDTKVTSSHDYSSGAIPGGGVSGGYVPGAGVADDWRNNRGGKNNLPGSAMSPFAPQQAGRGQVSRPSGMAGAPTQRSEFGAAGAIWGTGAEHEVNKATPAHMDPRAQPWRQSQQQQQQQQQSQQQQQQQHNSQQQQYQQQYNSQQQGSISSNVYSSGAAQNNGNVMTGRSTTRRLAPPGGFSSFSLG